MEFDEWKEKQWRDFYGPQVGRSRYLKTYDCKRFFDDYQILRNVAYITEENGEKEYVVFVVPMHNSGVKLLPQIVGREWDHVYQVNAEDIFTDVMIMVGSRADDRGFDFEKYYKRFCEFYFG